MLAHLKTAHSLTHSHTITAPSYSMFTVHISESLLTCLIDSGCKTFVKRIRRSLTVDSLFKTAWCSLNSSWAPSQYLSSLCLLFNSFVYFMFTVQEVFWLELCLTELVVAEYQMIRRSLTLDCLLKTAWALPHLVMSTITTSSYFMFTIHITEVLLAWTLFDWLWL